MHAYLIAIGSNRRSRFGSPRALIQTLLRVSASPRETLQGFTRRRGNAEGIKCSRIIQSAPIGPSQRCYANAVALIESDLTPLEMLERLKAIERAYGRRRGQRWGDRVLDLDIIGWSGGLWATKGLSIPHPAFRTRRFVLAPLAEIAPDWRDPVTHLTVRQLRGRLDRKRPRA